MGLSRRCRKPDEDHDAIAAGVEKDVDVKIGLPVIEWPDVTGSPEQSKHDTISRLNFI
jgi:hypothetical protein